MARKHRSLHPFSVGFASRLRSRKSRRGSSLSSLASRHGQLESLEERRVLDGVPLISEFQASNQTTIQDVDGDYSDWIEIRNPDVTSINIGGWYLTDDLQDLTKWQFPVGTTIDAGQHLVVFASDKDRRDPAGELHTNFRLSASGEDLALVRPDGVTVEQSYSPFPAQVPDQSYGLAVGRDIYSFIEAGAAAKAFVPTSDALGSTWTAVGFDDSAWQSGTSGVGYEVLAPGFEVTDDFTELSSEWTMDIPAGSEGRISHLGGILGDAVQIAAPTGQDMTEADRGLAPILMRSLPGDGIADYEIITEVTQGSSDRGAAGIVIFDAATGLPAVQFEYSSRLSFRLLAGGETQGSDVSLSRSNYILRLVRDSRTRSWTASYKLRPEDEWEQVGSAVDGVEGTPIVSDPRVGIYARTPSSTMNATFERFDIVVPDQSPVYGPEIGLDVGAAMRDNNASVYVRVPFEVNVDPSILDELTLTARYDDGFRAFLNGVEITAQNVPIESTWESAASTNFGAVNGVIPSRSISVGANLGALRQGTNVLAIQGMNLDAADLDFFLDVQLAAADVLSETQQAFITPTPGADNALPAAPSPQIIGQQGVFFGSTTVELALPDAIPGLEIRYTLDGSDPSPGSPLYQAPLILNQSAMLQARTFDSTAEPLFATSNAVGGTFTAVDPAIRSFNSNLPLLVLDSLGQGLPGSGATTLVPMNVVLIDVSKASGRASLEGTQIEYLGRGGARDRGSSTAGQAKPNMAFEIWGPNGTTQDDDFNTSLLGLANDADYVLHAPFSFDRALMRNPLAFEWSNQMGMWATNYRYVEVYLNRGGDGVVAENDYAGVYVLHERIEQGPDQLDIAGIDPSVTRDPNITDITAPQDISGGYIVKIDRADPGEPGFSAGGQSLNWVQPNSPRSSTSRDDQKATQEQQDWLVEYINAFAATLSNPDINDPEGYSKYIDPVSWADHHLLNVFMMNVDALRLSAYLHKDRNERLKFGPVWDFDRSAESSDDRDDDPLVWRSQRGDLGTDFFGNGTQRWWGNLFQDPGFWQLYVDRWAHWRRTVLSDENINAVIDDMTAELSEGAERNWQRWSASRPRTNSGYVNNVLDGTYQGEVDNMRTWLLERAQFMDNNFAPYVQATLRGEMMGNENGALVSVGEQIELAPPELPFFRDNSFVSGNVGETTASYLVPSNNDLGDTWTAVGFNDSSWTSAPLGIGFDPADNPDFDETVIATQLDPNEVVPGATNVFLRIPFQVDNLAQAQANSLILRLKYDDGFVAYLNGVEVARDNVRGELSWDGRATSQRDTDAVEFADFDISEFSNQLRAGENVLAIRAINSSPTSNDMLMLPALVSRETLFGVNGTVYYTTDGTDPRGPDGQPSPSARAMPGGGSVTITENTRIMARNFDSSFRGPESRIVLTNWSGLTQYDFSVQSQRLAISEIAYNPADPSPTEIAAGFTDNDEFEFIEIYNPSPFPIDLRGVKLTDGVEFDFYTAQIQTLQPGAYAVVVKNTAAFEARFGDQVPVAGVFTGSLSNQGEDVDLINASGDVIFSVQYGVDDPWPVLPNGGGPSLNLINLNRPAQETQSKYYAWEAGSSLHGSPGTADLAKGSGVVINEVLSRPAANGQDSIELRNVSTASVDVSGWYLSDSLNDLFKFQIPAGTVLAPGAMLVFTEANFNAANDPNGFGLSGTGGDNLYLVRGTKAPAGSDVAFGGLVTHFVDDVHFRATKEGVSLGRLPNGSGRLTPLQTPTFGQDNVNPLVGPIVITEIQYNPVPSEAALAADPTLEASDLEFIEIHNPTAAAVDLTDWRLRGGADYNFADGTMLAAGEALVLLSFNPNDPENINQVNAFRAHYGIDQTVRLIGGYGGLLGNSDDDLILLRAETSADDNDVIRVQEDEVIYDDRGSWPIAADGTGRSLNRRSPSALGNDPASWFAAAGTPGRVNTTIPGDLNGDNRADEADINALFVQMRSATPDLAFDLTGDGKVDALDRDELVLNLIGTTYGDADVNGIFNSGDLVRVFIAGGYEDNVAGNSAWESGDWDGDGEFTSADIVLSMQAGGFVPAAVPAPATGNGNGNGLGNGGKEIPGDLTGDGRADEADINALFEQIRSDDPDLVFDLNDDSKVDVLDRDVLVLDLLGTVFGDTNVNGVFNTGDLVRVFQVGQYEDDVAGNSTWETGDWNGDGEFNSADIVLAMQTGGFVPAAVANQSAAEAVDESIASLFGDALKEDELGQDQLDTDEWMSDLLG